MTPFERCSAIWSGTVAQRALRWAVASGVLAVVYHRVLDENEEVSHVSMYLGGMSDYEKVGWSLFTMTLGFLTALRAQLAYSRYWEGITLVERACGVWLNGCSNLIAFCSTSSDSQNEVRAFQFVLSRLMSLLVCYSMCDISKLDRECFPHLDMGQICPESIKYVDSTSARQNIVLQWVQRLVVEKHRSGIIDIAPPILSRVFQEFSIGFVHMIDANKITTVRFPFHFAQLTWIMLAFYCMVPLPTFCALGMAAPKAAALAFLVSLVFWSLHYAAVCTERPFGSGPHDLPLQQVNHRFNSVLQRLLEQAAQETPILQYSSMDLPDPDGGKRFESCDGFVVQPIPSVTSIVSTALRAKVFGRSSTLTMASDRTGDDRGPESLGRQDCDPGDLSDDRAKHGCKLGSMNGQVYVDEPAIVEDSWEAAPSSPSPSALPSLKPCASAPKGFDVADKQLSAHEHSLTREGEVPIGESTVNDIV
eukprot:CAMPEP_0176041760 /NCGR_PEP_ID=MMETSP0120_2-20121206/20717_1 /TAXON_ID=160619 /ORGANISM="Kryptoperidinium foliaceum, Strain CCMP 1326" /LENGTH=476 /DNA_ID=CAMNT_0017375167 /DNA_START=33 /DNA_END=1463 /DNA_ORIENTATION=-